MFYLFLYQHPSLAEGLAAVCSTHAKTVGLLRRLRHPNNFPKGQTKGGPVDRQRLADLLIRFDAKTGDRMNDHRFTSNDYLCNGNQRFALKTVVTSHPRVSNLWK